MKPSFIIYACLFAAFTLNCHAIEQSASSNNAELTQPEKVQPQQDALDTLTQEANIPKQPDVKKVTADDSKVLGSESTKPVEQPKSKVDKALPPVEIIKTRFSGEMKNPFLCSKMNNVLFIRNYCQRSRITVSYGLN